MSDKDEMKDFFNDILNHPFIKKAVGEGKAMVQKARNVSNAYIEAAADAEELGTQAVSLYMASMLMMAASNKMKGQPTTCEELIPHFKAMAEVAGPALDRFKERGEI